MIEAFQKWFENSKARLEEFGVDVRVGEPSQGQSKNVIRADLSGMRYECNLLVWENGMADFHCADWEKTGDEIEVTHHIFSTEAELASALEDILQKMTR